MIEWAPAIIAGVLFAGTVSVVGYNSASNFLYLTDQASAQSQLDTLYQDIEGLCATPQAPGKVITLDAPSLEGMTGGDGELEADLTSCSNTDSDWSKDDLNSNCKIVVDGFDSGGNAEWEVEVDAENTGSNEKTITLTANRIGEAQCP